MERKLEHVGVCGRQKAKKVRARTPHRRGTTLRVRLAGDGYKNSAAMADGKRAHMAGAYQEHVATLARQAEERHAEGGSTAGRGRRKQVGQRIDKPMASQVVGEDSNARRTTAQRATLAGTNRQYISDVEVILRTWVTYRQTPVICTRDERGNTASSARRHTAARPSMPLRKSTDSIASGKFWHTDGLRGSPAGDQVATISACVTGSKLNALCCLGLSLPHARSRPSWKKRGSHSHEQRACCVARWSHSSGKPRRRCRCDARRSSPSYRTHPGECRSSHISWAYGLPITPPTPADGLGCGRWSATSRRTGHKPTQ